MKRKNETSSDQQNSDNQALAPSQQPPVQWRSLEEYRCDENIKVQKETEFSENPLTSEEVWEGPEFKLDRRDFFKLMGAGAALSTVGCLRRPVEKIVPFVDRPPEMIPGNPLFYSSVWHDGGDVFGLVVKTREGRPIKIEGNSHHPWNHGKSSLRTEAHIRSLYDPDRLKSPLKSQKSLAWDQVDQEILGHLQAGGVHLITRTLASPSTQKILKQFKNKFQVTHTVWEPLGVGDLRKAQEICYGEAVLPYFNFSKSRYTVSLGADFLGTWISPTRYAYDFSRTRVPGPQMSRLVVFEPLLSLTGANSDSRYRIKSSQLIDVVMGLLYELIVSQKKTNYSENPMVIQKLRDFSQVPEQVLIPREDFVKIAQDLWNHRGESLVVTGGPAASVADSVNLQIAVNFLNHILENDGRTINSRSTSQLLMGTDSQLAQLIEALKKGSVKTLLVHDLNLVYLLGPSWKELLQDGHLIHIGSLPDETEALANYSLPESHAMESWSDSEPEAGLLSLQQPTIRPLYDTRSFSENLFIWLTKSGEMGLPSSWYAFVRKNWEQEVYPRFAKPEQSFEEFWIESLHLGVRDSNSEMRQNFHDARAFKLDALQNLGTSKLSLDFELVLYSKPAIGDGRMANISWLMEFPDPVSKVSWDNYLALSVRTAEKYHLQEGSWVQMRIGDLTRKVPIHIQPGLHDDVAGLAVGYGHARFGKVAQGIGIKAFDLAVWGKDKLQFAGIPLLIEKLNEPVYPLANVQGHHMENDKQHGRPLAITVSNKDYLKNPGAGIHHHHLWSIWPGHEYKSYKWSMTVDMNSCIGCGICMVACQSENNIPNVGKQYVLKSREMYWIVIDRYFSGSPEDPEVVFQPRMCQHCDNAPCETVCPVLATTHTTEGLNDMVYNRCVGTRYCSNNCPYKVRRFNWFRYDDKVERPLTLQLNPDVTIRSRGVMEKCTFCVQRIQAAKQKAKGEARDLRDGDIVTACQAACPTEALIFGDRNNMQSHVYASQKEARTYSLLEEWNAAPSVKYMTKIRNVDRSMVMETDHSEAPHSGESPKPKDSHGASAKHEGEHT